MNEHQKYIIQEKLRHDKQQTIFTESGLGKTKSPLAINITTIKDEIVFCPFCLGKYQLNKFLISTKKGYNKNLGKCPECQNQMRLETLNRMLKWNPKEYAEFVYEYPAPAFWKKCSFNKWKNRLYEMNMSYNFWNTYKQLKEENSYTEATQDTEENYNEFIERQKNREEYYES